MPGRIRYYDVTLEHMRPGEVAGDRPRSGIRIHCKVQRVPAYDPEEACHKAMRFLTMQGKRGIRVVGVKEQNA